MSLKYINYELAPRNKVVAHNILVFDQNRS